MTKPILEIRPSYFESTNKGYSAVEYDSQEYYNHGVGRCRLDLDVMPRAFWLHYADVNGYTLKIIGG